MGKKSTNKMITVYLFIYLHFKGQVRIYLLQKAIRVLCLSWALYNEKVPACCLLLLLVCRVIFVGFRLQK